MPAPYLQHLVVSTQRWWREVLCLENAWLSAVQGWLLFDKTEYCSRVHGFRCSGMYASAMLESAGGGPRHAILHSSVPMKAGFGATCDSSKQYPVPRRFSP